MAPRLHGGVPSFDMPASNIIVSGADDPSTMSFRDTTPAPSGAPSEQQQFLADWNAAQQRYRAGVNAGYSDADAADLYLAPVKNKWDILKSVPETMQKTAGAELDAANKAYVAGVNAGYKPEDAQNLFLKPQEQKWVAAADVPDKKKLTLTQQMGANPVKQYEAQQDEQSALNKIAAGRPVKKVIEEYPLLMSMPGFSTRWNARYNAALAHDQTQAAAALKEKAAADKAEEKSQLPAALLGQASKLFKLTAPGQLPTELSGALNENLAKVSSQLTNRPAATPPADAPAPAAAAPPTANLPAKDKVALANKIAAAHPDWTKEQVILAVQGKLKGAE